MRLNCGDSNCEKIVEVQWQVDGNNGHISADPAASVFSLFEYRNNRETVKHTIRPVSGQE
jgi:hypothetical protein